MSKSPGRPGPDRHGQRGVEALLLSLGADLPWLSGYTAMPLERLTMLVLPADGQAILVVPRLEAPRVEEDPDVFELLPWNEGQDPVEIVAGLVGVQAPSGHLGSGVGHVRAATSGPGAGLEVAEGVGGHRTVAGGQGPRRGGGFGRGVGRGRPGGPAWSGARSRWSATAKPRSPTR